MFRLRSLYAAFIVMASFYFMSLFTRGKMPYVYINILLACIAPAAYVYSSLFTYASISILWLVIFPALVLIFKVNPVNVFASLMIFTLLAIAYHLYRDVVKRERKLRHKALNKFDNNRFRLFEDLQKAIRFENGMRLKESEIVNLYEITSRMSEHLKLEDIFHVFSDFLKTNFTFRRCDLLVLDHADDSPAVGRVFSVSREDSIETNVLNGERLIALFRGGCREVWLSKEDDPSRLKNLGIEDDDVETFVALPLLSELKIVGILAMENLPKEDLERFAILAMQFALGIRKALLYEIVERLAITDSLSGLYVRRYFYERVAEELRRTKMYNFEFSFIMVDIDDFKKCNDTYGHMVGDVAIKDITRIIRENVREIDIVGRYGGEEFSIALPETGRESALAVAERLRRKVEETVFRAYDEQLKLTISLGVAVYPKDAYDLNEIIEKADQAMYEAKKSGKNVVREYKK